MITVWESLKEKLPEESYTLVRERFERQLANAREWRDQVNSYFYRKSGILDEKKEEQFIRKMILTVGSSNCFRQLQF